MVSRWKSSDEGDAAGCRRLGASFPEGRLLLVGLVLNGEDTGDAHEGLGSTGAKGSQADDGWRTKEGFEREKESGEKKERKRARCCEVAGERGEEREGRRWRWKRRRLREEEEVVDEAGEREDESTGGELVGGFRAT